MPCRAGADAVGAQRQGVRQALDDRVGSARLQTDIRGSRHGRNSVAQRPDTVAARKDAGQRGDRIRRLRDGRGPAGRPPERPQLLLDGARPAEPRQHWCAGAVAQRHLRAVLHPAALLPRLRRQPQLHHPLPPLRRQPRRHRRRIGTAGHPARISRRRPPAATQPLVSHPHREQWRTRALHHRRPHHSRLCRPRTADVGLVRIPHHGIAHTHRQLQIRRATRHRLRAAAMDWRRAADRHARSLRHTLCPRTAQGWRHGAGRHRRPHHRSRHMDTGLVARRE